MNRRSFLKRMLAGTLAMFGIGGGTYYYAREIEPGMLTIHQEDLMSAKIPQAFNHFKILQFSDTHVGFHYSLEQLAGLVETINQQEPDVIVFTGDLVDAPDDFAWNKQIVNILNNLQAPYGKYWIYGNHDHGGYGTDIVKTTMEAANFTLLLNSHTTIEKDGRFFNLAGLDDVMLGQPDIQASLNGANPDAYTIMLVHEPDYAETTKHFPVDIQLSGHSHGGQVQVPLIGYIYTPTYAERYVEGEYEVDNGLRLFVSRGVGTTRLPYRFLCKPEITVFHLRTL